MQGPGNDELPAALPGTVPRKGYGTRVHCACNRCDSGPCLKLGGRGAWAHQCDPYSRRFELLRQGFGERKHERLCRVINREHRTGDKPRTWPDVDHAA